LRDEGFSPTVAHRDLAAAPQDSLEGAAGIAHDQVMLGDGIQLE
jgi:UPF0042 nucleotide-binding protein